MLGKEEENEEEEELKMVEESYWDHFVVWRGVGRNLAEKKPGNKLVGLVSVRARVCLCMFEREKNMCVCGWSLF